MIHLEYELNVDDVRFRFNEENLRFLFFFVKFNVLVGEFWAKDSLLNSISKI